MAIFDSNKVQNLTFYIVFDDAEAVEAFNTAHPEGYNVAPETGAAVEFDAPWQGVLASSAGLVAPITYTDWPSSPSKPFPTNVATFQRHTGGFLGIGGTTTRYYWIGKAIYQPNFSEGEGGGAAEYAPTPKRRWVEGFETPSRISTSSNQGRYCTVDASRHPGGRGLAIRHLSAVSLTLTPAQFDTGLGTVGKQWERLYIRLRKKPSSTVWFWRNSVSGSPGKGTALGITADGGIAIATISATAVVTVATVIPGVTLEEWNGEQTHDVWAKLDLVYEVAATAAASSFKTYVNGVLRSTAGTVDGGGTAQINSSTVGAPISGTADLDLDLDDWSASAWPTEGGVFAASIDFAAGTKIALVRPRSFDAATTGWAGAVQVLGQNSFGFTPAEMTSSTSGALLVVDTDGEEVIHQDPQHLGAVALAVVAYSKRGTTSGSLGYQIGANPAVNTAITQTTSLASQAVLFSAEAGLDGASLPDVTPLKLRHTKGADVGAATIASLQAMVEIVGKFNLCDYTATELAAMGEDPGAQLNYGTGSHNWMYPRTPWAKRGLAPPISPVVHVAGTYVGNGTGQDLTFKTPVHWLWIRPTSGTSTGGALWISPALGGHYGHQEGIQSGVTFAEADPTFVAGDGADDVQQFRFRVRLAGADQQINAAGVTYQYVAISDPGMRFFVTGGFYRSSATDVQREHQLAHPGFTPEFLFLMGEAANSTTTQRLYLKGPGQAAATVALFSGGTIASALTFAEGRLITETALHDLDLHFGYMAVRRADGLQSPTQAQVVAFGTYTGDGTASRTVGISPASGRRPMFAMVYGESGLGYSRDPSHTGTNSLGSAGTNSTTGITGGGVDSLSVGSSLNANGVVYNYFVLFGIDACTSSGGWGCNGEVIPVEPESPAGDGPWPPDPEEPEEPEEPDDGDPGGEFPGGNPADAVDFSSACVAWSTHLANVALSRIGVGKQISNIATDVSEEAFKARLIYSITVEAVLRDFPWPFATRYADLTLVSGSETSWANKDWKYAYRAPGNMVAARRLVSQELEQRGYDPDPPQFRVGTDSTGWLIYANVPITAADAAGNGAIPVQLEYTYRMTCPAQQGDPLFKDALIWKLAAALALPLARDKDKAEWAERNYQQQIVAAKEVAANESQKDNETGDAPWIRAR